jgi:hypothetical protein
MEQQELEKRISDLKGALEQSAAAHNALVGKGIELKSLIDLLPEQRVLGNAIKCPARRNRTVNG